MFQAMREKRRGRPRLPRYADALNTAVDVLGSRAALARVLDISRQAVEQALKGARPVPPDWCRKIASATRGKVTAAQLRPDLFA